MNVAFVSCVKTKSTTPKLAEHLYISTWFRMAREYAIRNADRWFILSASGGLVRPDRMMDPYDLTLNGLGKNLRFTWADMVIGQIEEYDLRGTRAIVLAGKNYREFLMQELTKRFQEVDVPMEGLMMGQQLNWMKTMLGSRN